VYKAERVAVAGKLLFRSIARLRMLERKRFQPVRRFARFNDRNLVQAFEYCGRLLTEQCLLAARYSPIARSVAAWLASKRSRARNSGAREGTGTVSR
jgi:hypothetical protein